MWFSAMSLNPFIAIVVGEWGLGVYDCDFAYS